MFTDIKTLIGILTPVILITIWLFTALADKVDAADFQVHKEVGEIKWLMYDVDKLWREHDRLSDRNNRTPTEEARLRTVIRELERKDKKIQSLRGE